MNLTRKVFRRRTARAELTLAALFDLLHLPRPDSADTTLQVRAEVVMNGSPPFSWKYEGEAVILTVQYEEQTFGYGPEEEITCLKSSPNTD